MEEGKPVSKRCSSASITAAMSAAGSSSSSHSHCIFCLKPTRTPPKMTDLYSTRRAVSLLERHLKLEPGSGSNQDYNVCRSCARRLETFSGYYEQIKDLELKLEAEVDKLRSVVEHANRVPTRGAFVKQCYSDKGGGGTTLAGMMSEMYTWRRTVSKRCLKKLSSNFPKVVIPKLGIDEDSVRFYGGDAAIISANGGVGFDFNDIEIDIKYEIPSPPPYSPQANENDQDYVADSIPNDSSSNDEDLEFLPKKRKTKKKLSIKNNKSNCKPTTASSATADPKIRPYNKTTRAPPLNRWCDVCSTLFRTNYHFKRHFKNAHDLKAAGLEESQASKCSKCPAYFITTRQLVQHVTRFHQNDSEDVKTEPEDPPTGSRNAEENFKNGTRFYCSACPKWFFTPASRTSHFKSNHEVSGLSPEEEVVKCAAPGCSAFFRTVAQLNKHKLEFHEERNLIKKPVEGLPCICVECGEAFKTQYKLLVHRQAKHKVVKRTFPCGKCGTVLASRNSLNLHLLRHQGPDSFRFECPTCGLKVITKEHLGRHMETHRKKKKKK